MFKINANLSKPNYAYIRIVYYALHHLFRWLYSRVQNTNKPTSDCFGRINFNYLNGNCQNAFQRIQNIQKYMQSLFFICFGILLSQVVIIKSKILHDHMHSMACLDHMQFNYAELSVLKCQILTQNK